MSIAGVTGGGNPLKPNLSPERMKELGQQVNNTIKSGRAIDLSPLFEAARKNNEPRPKLPHYQDRYEGKTIVENKGSMGFVVTDRFTPDGQIVDVAGYENDKALAGSPTHGFFHRKTDFLMEAAKEYAKLGENEVFRHRGIEDSSFVRDALDFFTDGKYSSIEQYSISEQMTNVVFELAQQIKNGESPDVNKVQSKLTIGGVDFTISQLLDFQKVGGELKKAYNDISVGELNVSRSGKMGLAKSLANYYGSTKGEAGAMFSKAMDKMYDKAVTIVEKLAARPNYGTNMPVTDYGRSVLKTSSAVRDTLASIDTSSKERFEADFTAKLGTVRAIVQEHSNQFNVPDSFIGLAGSTADLMKYFSSLLGEM